MEMVELTHFSQGWSFFFFLEFSVFDLADTRVEDRSKFRGPVPLPVGIYLLRPNDELLVRLLLSGVV